MTNRLQAEISETQEFIDFLQNTERVRRIDIYPKTSKCIHVLEDFSALATQNHPETIEHLHQIQKEYKPIRDHALDCKRCQEALDAIFLFKGYKNQRLFPEKINKILNLAWKYNSNNKLFLVKLPAPLDRAYSSKARLVYITNSPIETGMQEFETSIKQPLGLQGLTSFTIPHAKKSSAGKGYWQTECHHKHPLYHTSISIRSRKK